MADNEIIGGSSAFDINIINDNINVDIKRSKQKIILDIASTLYTYSDFSRVDNIRAHAQMCLQRARIFYEEYAKEYEKIDNYPSIGIK